MNNAVYRLLSLFIISVYSVHEVADARQRRSPIGFILIMKFVLNITAATPNSENSEPAITPALGFFLSIMA